MTFLKRYVGLTRLHPPKRKKPKPAKGCMPFYRQGIDESDWRCEECNGYIPHSEPWQQFSAQCHILPKDIFRSVMNCIHNRLHLCLSCHKKWDSSWMVAITMKVWPVAIKRFLLFYQQLTDEEFGKLPGCFIEPVVFKYFSESQKKKPSAARKGQK